MSDTPSATRAVFLSYASQDAEAVTRLAGALRAAGVEVWFDQDELRGGDAWDRKIRKQIRECALFVPVISANTQARPEGYFRLEWHLAEQRSLLIAKGRPFIVPVCLDTTPERDALVPDAFLHVQWTRLNGGETPPAFVERVKRLLVGGVAQASSRLSQSAGRMPALLSDPRIPDYELIRKIGSGSYGDVWLARGLTGVYRAIKIVWRDRFADAEPFEREFNGLKKFTAMALPEASQLGLLHVGQNEGAGFFYYVMELADDVQGGRDVNPATYAPLTLKEVRARRGRLPAAECVTLGIGLARALAGLHERGLVHRDIKPSNVILVGGVPKLADIGLVATAGEALTQVGTPGFVPPEGPGRARADVYALGRLLYELATGLDREEFPRLPAQLGAGADRKLFFRLNAVILRACEPDPAKRQVDAAALLADLLKLEPGSNAGAASGGSRADTSHPWLRVVMPLAGVALSLIFMFKSVWKRERRAEPKPPAVAPAASQTPEKSIAVLPFANLSGDAAQEYFSDGLTEEVLSALAREHDLRVAGRTSSFSFKGKNVAAVEIARALNVAQLVEGSVQRAGGRVRINVRLTRAADGFSESLGNFDRETTDIFALQDEVARVVVEKLTRRTSTKAPAVLTGNPEAYDAYLRGRALQVRAAGDAPAAARFFEQAVALDPAFALAWARLSQARFRGYGGMNDRSPAVVDSSREAVDRALALQPDLPEALIARAHWLRAAACDFPAARRDLARAEALQPATAELRFAQCVLARDMDDWPEAMRRAREALSLDPQNGDAINAIAITIFAPRGDFAEADRLYARAMAIQGPGNLLPFRNRVILRVAWRGPEAALRLIDRAPAGQAGAENLRARVLRMMGRASEAREIADKLAAPTGSVAGFQGRNDGEINRLAADGGEAQARSRAEEIRADSLREFARGNHGPLVRLVYIEAEIALGHADAALAELGEWRRETQRLPSAYRRVYEFNLLAGDFYARLGRPDETKTLLREILANGFQPVFSFRPDLSFSDLRNDPPFQEAMKTAAAWAAAQPDPTDEPAPAAAPPPAATVPAAAEKSLVVLPLENLSPDPANAFFTDGMHSEIIATLSRIPDLRVISRASALTLKGAALSLTEAAQKFGIANVMTGNVRRAGRQIRIQLELRRASDEALLWSHTYAQELTDPLALQSDIAENVARALQAREGKGTFGGARFSTKSPEAFELFLKARGLFEIGDFRGDGMLQAVKLLKQALAIDAGFTSAASLLTNILADLARGAVEPAERVAYAAEAKTYAELAARLAPGGGGDAMLAFYYAVIEGESAKALALADNAARVLPNDAIHHNTRSIALAGLGRIEEALQAVRRARELDPATPVFRTNELLALTGLRRWDEFEAAMASDQGRSAAAAGLMLRARYELKGELPASLDGMSSLQRHTWLWLARKFAEAETDMADARKRPPVGDANRFRLLCSHHDVLVRLGRTDDAAKALREARELAERLQAAPEVGLSNKALYQAQLLVRQGRHEEAIAAGIRYVEATSSTTQTGIRWRREAELAEIQAYAGRPRECVALLAKLIKLPGTRITVPVLRIDPAWDNVREDPGFQALLADPKNSAPL